MFFTFHTFIQLTINCHNRICFSMSNGILFRLFVKLILFKSRWHFGVIFAFVKILLQQQKNVIAKWIRFYSQNLLQTGKATNENFIWVKSTVLWIKNIFLRICRCFFNGKNVFHFTSWRIFSPSSSSSFIFQMKLW